MKINIIGSGIAGMACAIRLAAKGHNVEVFESNSFPGGKIFEFKNNGYRFDMGPSLMTLPELVDDIFKIAGKNREKYLTYIKCPVSCKYFYEDKSTITAFDDFDKFEQNLLKNNINHHQLKEYLEHNSKVYNAAFNVFLNRPIHKLSTYYTKDAIRAFLALPSFKLLKTLHQVNTKYLKHPKLVQLFNRYATYNGSNPYKAPGIFTIISHLENNLGAYIVEGGMYNLAKALYKLAVEIGVNFYFNTTVSEIIIENHKAIGIKVSSKKYISDITISNADVNTTYNELLPDIKSPNIFLNQPRSSSSLIFYWAVNKKFPELDLHNILFSNDYKTEFAYIFDKKEVYHDPTIYIYITSKLFLQDAPENCENWFVSINVPCNEGQDWDRIINQSKVNIKNKINRLLNVNIDSHIEFEKIDDPRSIEHFTSSYKGALYGANSNNPFSAFLRHPNFSRKIKNLYFCGGTVHPGGGIPLCLLSGKITAELIEND